MKPVNLIDILCVLTIKIIISNNYKINNTSSCIFY